VIQEHQILQAAFRHTGRSTEKREEDAQDLRPAPDFWSGDMEEAAQVKTDHRVDHGHDILKMNGRKELVVCTPDLLAPPDLL
jgi:hypothetical protein